MEIKEIKVSKKVIASKKHEGGDCYQKAFDSYMYDPKFSGWKLVHGIAVISKGPHMGKDFGHAWLEKGEEVYDAATDQYLPKVLYYYFGKVSYEVSYSKEQAREMVLKFEHYGPWDEKINGALHSESKERKPKKKKENGKNGKTGKTGKTGKNGKNGKSESCIRLAKYLVKHINQR